MTAQTCVGHTSAARTASELRLVLGQLVRRLRAENNFSISQGAVLARLDREGPLTTSALAAAERVRPQSMAHTVAELQAAGLVARRPHPLDRRQILIELTDRGTASSSTTAGAARAGSPRRSPPSCRAEEQEILAQAVPLLRRLLQADRRDSMRIRWYGQSAFLLSGEQTVMIDPFGPMGELAAARGLVFDYPPIEGARPPTCCSSRTSTPTTTRSRSSAARRRHPLDGGHARLARRRGGRCRLRARRRSPAPSAARTRSSASRSTGSRFCHLGDFGQAALRPEQQEAIGEVDVLFVPVGGGPTVGGEVAAAIVRTLRPRLVVPMHYRTEAVNFLDPPDAFLEALGAPVERRGRAGIRPRAAARKPQTGQRSCSSRHRSETASHAARWCVHQAAKAIRMSATPPKSAVSSPWSGQKSLAGW